MNEADDRQREADAAKVAADERVRSEPWPDFMLPVFAAGNPFLRKITERK